MKKFSRIAFILFISGFYYYGYAAASLSVEYEKIQDGQLTQGGNIYFSQKNGMFLLLEYPLNQRVRIRPEQYLYFYPDEKIALIMNNPERTVAPSFLQLFLNTDREDPGLMELGFILKEHAVRQDTLIKTWERKGGKKSEFVRIDIYSYNERVCKTLSYDADGDILKEVHFAKWRRGDHYYYPMHIKIMEEESVFEYNYSNLHFIPEIPDAVIDLFMLPGDCEINEYSW